MTSLSQFFISLLIQYRYIVLFPVMVVEGPITTMASGFLVSIGFMNPLIALPIIVAGDLGGDVIYYFIGKFGERWILTRRVIEKFKFESMKERVAESFRVRGGKLLLFGKLTHAIGAIFLMGAGYTGMSFSYFLWYNLIGTIIKSSILLSIGYAAGYAYMQYARYFEYGAVIVTVVSLVLIYLVSRVMPRISHRIFHVPPESTSPQ